ncbi:MAG: hypothetical protein A2V86_15880 [Deltaproteobacteria bacterium RBG_16_49_23]|nr:MAG: hypothetical protein A2V86_15880 [Deltaproteobacteria bacterium RBG_16_49_23]
MFNIFLLFPLLFLFAFISGCAPAISPELRAKVDSSLTFRQIHQNPDAYKTKLVLWGGEILNVIPQHGETFIEVLRKPLGWRGKPKRAVAFQGKFLILVKEKSDLSLYKKGTRITVAGEILGEIQGDKIENLTDKTYRYPLILSRQIHLWKDYFSPYSGLPPPRSPHDPYWHDPFERPLRF